jgi:hypothetical protein
VKEQVLDEGQRTLDEQEYEVNDHAAPIYGFRFEVLVRSTLAQSSLCLWTSTFGGAALDTGSR